MVPEYYNLSDRQFEELVVEFCVELLGAGVQAFVSGADGGRDAKFHGAAKLLPSEVDPWNGKIVIQAKHTEYPTKSYSDADFSGEANSSTLSKELFRIKKLIADDELEYYMLFANRRLSGVTEPVVRKRISAETGLPESNIKLYDVSELDRLCKRYPDAVARADLSPARAPADIDPTDLAEVITRLAEYQIDDLMEGEVPPPEQRISPAEKNRRTGLKSEYFNRQIRPKMIDFPTIRHFLAHPENVPFQKLYDDIADELEAKLDAWNDDDTAYERCLEALIERLFARDVDLRKHRRLTRTVVFYMYCNCDLGKEPDD